MSQDLAEGRGSLWAWGGEYSEGRLPVGSMKTVRAASTREPGGQCAREDSRQAAAGGSKGMATSSCKLFRPLALVFLLHEMGKLWWAHMI